MHLPRVHLPRVQGKRFPTTERGRTHRCSAKRTDARRNASIRAGTFLKRSMQRGRSSARAAVHFCGRGLQLLATAGRRFRASIRRESSGSGRVLAHPRRKQGAGCRRLCGAVQAQPQLPARTCHCSFRRPIPCSFLLFTSPSQHKAAGNCDHRNIVATCKHCRDPPHRLGIASRCLQRCWSALTTTISMSRQNSSRF